MSKDPKDSHTPKDTHYANLRRAHRDQKRERGELPGKPPGAAKAKAPWKAPQLPAETVWLYGIHTVKAAIDNPERKLLKLRVTRNALARLELNDAQMLGLT
ncbi:MAG: 23S rRNA (guanosine(2251)-2'-O)-methyltransferase RlmB, partial [Alphaproteobacteria bacterium]